MAEKQEAQLYALVSNGLRASKAIGVNEGIPNERSIFPVLQNYARQIEPIMTSLWHFGYHGWRRKISQTGQEDATGLGHIYEPQ